MKKETYILFTAGRGPLECCIAAEGIQQKFLKYLKTKDIEYEIISLKKGKIPKSIETIVFKTLMADKSILAPWLGTIQWVCQSPIRKYHKRKNWFIKCELIDVLEKVNTSVNDITIQTYKASGPGGQHRNKVETAIRIIHRPSGIIVTSSDAKSQNQNKKKALQKLKTILQNQNNAIDNEFNLDKWTAQIVIERGNPIRTFRGTKFQ